MILLESDGPCTLQMWASSVQFAFLLVALLDWTWDLSGRSISVFFSFPFQSNAVSHKINVIKAGVSHLYAAFAACKLDF